jgi:NADPH:quinone reductase-like Zn-dependent oxidoreductase
VFSGKKAKKMGLMILKSGRKHLESCMEALDKEKITPVIDSIFTFDEVPEAFRFFGKGLVEGKLVITVGNG